MNNADRLQVWVQEVLRMHPGQMPLEDGREATVHYEDGCVYAYTYDEKDEIVYAARVRLVSEDPRED